MKIMVLGADGYLGWPTAMYFSARGHEVYCIDNYIKRTWENRAGVKPLVPVMKLHNRIHIWRESKKGKMEYSWLDITKDYSMFRSIVRAFSADAIIHYAEQPSAPYSMMSAIRTIETQRNNVLGTLALIHIVKEANPKVHIVKLGTMGEYGTPNIDIEEGWLDVQHNGRTDRILYPKRPGSFYHLSKVHDSANLEFACRTWGLRVTDLNQGIVYGIETDEMEGREELGTSFHYDECFGTVLNRFVVQAAKGIPLTVYGKGKQIRTFLNIRDTLRCVELAVENPAVEGEFRVMNQYTEVFSIIDLAHMVTAALGISSEEIKLFTNPRVEEGDHYYNPKNDSFKKLGLKSHSLSPSIIQRMFDIVSANIHRVDSSIIEPKTKWR